MGMSRGNFFLFSPGRQRFGVYNFPEKGKTKERREVVLCLAP
jgi:hypothetical protein